MEALVLQLLDNGFHEVGKDGGKVSKEETSTNWNHVQAKDVVDQKTQSRSTKFQKGKKAVTFTHQPSGSTAYKHVRFTDGEHELAYSSNGDIPSQEFMDAFFEKQKAAAEAPKEEAKKK